MTRRIAPMVVVFVAGCTGTSGKRADHTTNAAGSSSQIAPASAQPSASDCRQGAHELATLLRTSDHSVRPVWTVPEDLHLVARPELAPLKVTAGSTAQLYPDKLAWDDNAIASADIASADIAKSAAIFADEYRRGAEDAARSARHDVDVNHVNVLIDEAASWRDVLTMLRVFGEAGFTHPTLFFAGPPNTKRPPPRSSVSDRLEAVLHGDPSTKVTALANLMAATITHCGALDRLFEQIGSTEGDKVEMLLDGVELALVQCNCNLDLPALRSLLWAMLVNAHPLRALDLVLAHGGKRTTIPAETRWQEAQAQLHPGDEIDVF